MTMPQLIFVNVFVRIAGAAFGQLFADFWLGLQLDWDLWHALPSEEAKAIAKLSPLPRAS